MKSNKSMYFNIKKVLFKLIAKKISLEKKYIFINGNPVDTRSEKYGRFRRLFNQKQLKCKCCGMEATRFKLVKCTSDGWLHEETGKRKYTFMLVNKNDEVMTFDHLIPKSFLKENGMRNKKENWVLMCQKCNHFKDDLVPENWEELYKRMK